MLQSFSCACRFMYPDPHSSFSVQYVHSWSAGVDFVSRYRPRGSVGGRLAAVESCYKLLVLTFDRISWLQQFRENQGGFVTQTCWEAGREITSLLWCLSVQYPDWYWTDKKKRPHLMLCSLWGKFWVQAFSWFVVCVHMHVKSPRAWYFLLWLNLEAYF